MRAYTLVAGFLSASLAVASPQGDQQSSVLQCLDGKKVPYKMASSPGYEDYAEPFNLRLPYKPLVIALPTSNQHVQDAVICAGKHGVKVQAKSGGHSYASFSSGGKDGSMMISLESFNKVQLDTTTGIAKAGGGVRLGNLARAIFDQGKAALPHGTCPGVGLGGHATHGGYGHTSRNWGLAMDTIVGADVVLANGTLVKTDATKYPEVFWAIRGAADSFGIITSFYLKTQKAPESITYFSFGFEGMWNNKDTFTKSFLHIQDFANNASVVDNRFSVGFYMDGGAFSGSGAFFGTVDEFNQKIKPEFLRTLPTPSSTEVKAYSWIDYLILVSGADTIDIPLTGYDEHDNFFAKSITVPEKDGLSTNALNAFFDAATSDPDASFFTIINLYGGPGSAINQKDTNFAAYNDRDSLWVFQNYGMGAVSINFINGLNSAVIEAQPDTHFGAYLNYVDPSYDAATAHKLYYGDELYARLLELKKKLDPKSVYWNPQAIGA